MIDGTRSWYVSRISTPCLCTIPPSNRKKSPLNDQGTFHPPSTSKTVTNTGLIWIYAYTNPHLPDSQALKPLTFPNFPHASDFHPLGLSFEAKSSTLYVVNHSRTTGSVVEIFKVSLKSAVAEHIRTFTHPLLHAPNAIHNLGDGKLFISNDHYIRAAVSPFLSKVETFSGIPGGTVVYTDIQNPDATKIVARVPFANGVAMLNASTLAVASSSSYGVYFYELGANHTLGYKAFIRTPAGADNLSVDSEGRLLVAGHPFAPTLMGVAGRRVGCDEEGSEEERAACRCDAPSWVGEWREGEGVRTLLRDGGEGEKGVCSSSTAVRDVKRGVGMVSMLYGRGLVVFKE